MKKDRGQGLKPEQEARLEIDKLLLRDFKDCTLGDSTPNAARNFAIKEFILENGTRADSLLRR